jgi:uncharacterized SAM-binding protein YcdF (DUF218 family)
MENFKLIVSACLSPIWICLILQLVGWWLMWRTSARRGSWWLAAGTAALLFGSLSGPTFELRRQQEYVFAPLNPELDLTPQRTSLAVVLGTGFNDDPEVPANSRVSGNFLARLLEGVRVYRSHPDCRLVVSVAGEATAERKLQFVSEMVTLLQLDPDRVQTILNAESTSDEADAIAELRNTEQVIVVTSAAHMVRAMRTFDDAGLEPIAAPADYGYRRAGSPSEKIWPLWVPSNAGIHSTHQWLYEQVAYLWQTLRG